MMNFMMTVSVVLHKLAADVVGCEWRSCLMCLHYI